jgi:DNA-binding beta-propeller fold protein YncE
MPRGLPIAAALLALAAHPITTSAQSPRYHLARRITLGGDGGWDYLTVDTAANRLYVSRGTHVQVVDLARDSLIGDIPNTPGVHGIAIARDVGHGYTSNGRDSTVTVFDLKTLAVLKTLKIPGANPDAIFYDEATHRVFTFNGRSGDATAIDARTDAVAGTVPLGGKPEAATTDGRRIFVNIEDTGEIVAFDPRTLAVLARWPLAPCEDPTGMGIDRAHKRLFAACSNKMMAVVDYESGRLVTTVPIGAGSDGAAFDPASQLAFTTNGGDGTLTVVHEDAPDRFSVVATVPTETRARTIALDPKTHRIYTITADFGPPPPATAEQPRPRPRMVDGSFRVLVIEPGTP